jgi:hypothetical protein
MQRHLRPGCRALHTDEAEADGKQAVDVEECHDYRVRRLGGFNRGATRQGLLICLPLDVGSLTASMAD